MYLDWLRVYSSLKGNLIGIESSAIDPTDI